MLFTRTNTYYFPMGKDELKNRLAGKHVNIHNLDFEILEKDNKLCIIPHAEQVETIKTLPITTLVFNEEGNRTKVVATSRMRQLDSGGPLLIITFSLFMIIAALWLLDINRDPLPCFTLMGMAASILTLFMIRLQIGYFDYVRKVQTYIRIKCDPSYVDNSVPFARTNMA